MGYVIIGFVVIALLMAGWATVGVKQMRQEVSRWVVTHYERIYDLAYQIGSEVVHKSRVGDSFEEQILSVPYPTLQKVGAPWKVISPKKFFKKFTALEEQLETAMNSLDESYSISKMDEIEAIYNQMRELYEQMGFGVSTVIADDKHRMEPNLKLVK